MNKDVKTLVCNKKCHFISKSNVDTDTLYCFIYCVLIQFLKQINIFQALCYYLLSQFHSHFIDIYNFYNNYSDYMRQEHQNLNPQQTNPNHSRMNLSNYNIAHYIIYIVVVLVIIAVFSNINHRQQQPKHQISFMENIWNEVAPYYLEQIEDTQFMEDIEDGKLDPLYWARYIGQQVYFLQQSIKIWHEACKMGKDDSTFFQYCQQVAKQQKEYAQEIQEKAFLFEVKPLPAVQKYIQQKRKHLQQHGYNSVSIPQYVCYKLYHQFSSDLLRLNEMNKRNVYYNWVKGEATTFFVEKEQKRINENKNLFDREMVKQGIIKFLQLELQFFQACSPPETPKRVKIN